MLDGLLSQSAPRNIASQQDGDGGNLPPTRVSWTPRKTALMSKWEMSNAFLSFSLSKSTGEEGCWCCWLGGLLSRAAILMSLLCRSGEYDCEFSLNGSRGRHYELLFTRFKIGPRCGWSEITAVEASTVTMWMADEANGGCGCGGCSALDPRDDVSPSPERQTGECCWNGRPGKKRQGLASPDNNKHGPPEATASSVFPGTCQVSPGGPWPLDPAGLSATVRFSKRFVIPR